MIALGLGANIIERHFTLDKKLEGPDHILSSEPHEIKKLVEISKNSLNILGDGIKRIQPSEYTVINSQRKSIYTKKNIKKGEKITKNHITIKGPGGGIVPKHLELILNRKTKFNIAKDYPRTWDMI